MRATPLDDMHVEAAVRYCLAQLRGTADRLGGRGVRPPGSGHDLVSMMVHGFAGTLDRAGWVVLDGSTVRGFAGATFVDLTPDDWRYTFMPPRSMSIAATACHLDTTEAVLALHDAVRPAAADRGMPRLLIASAPDAETVRAAWRGAGLRPDVVMAVRDMSNWPGAGSSPAGIVVRTAAPSDVDSLTDLALEEHRYHATHTKSGTSPDQPRETSRRLAEQAVSAPPETSYQLVAEDAASGAVVGSLLGMIHILGDDQVQRFLLPPRYGYIGLTSVTAAHRGGGVGRALVDAAMNWFANHQVDSVFLHYVVDNPLSARFWTRLGFAARIHVDGVWL